MKVAVIGSTGQLGTDLMKALKDTNELIGLTHQDLEVTDYTSCLLLEKHQPDVIINTAAFHKTEQCEDEPLRAFLVNALGARNIAMISKEANATVVFISTDYVFDGSNKAPYTEDDQPNPINTYGISKLAGELLTKLNPRHYVIRVASLFGVAGASGKGGNFIETMLKKASQKEPISVVNDMWMSPTYTKDAALTIKKIIESKLPYGTYHATNEGSCTWFDLAKQIFQLTGQNPTLTPTKTDQTKAKARRPMYSALTSTKLAQHGIKTREWTEALQDYLIEKGHLQMKQRG